MRSDLLSKLACAYDSSRSGNSSDDDQDDKKGIKQLNISPNDDVKQTAVDNLAAKALPPTIGKRPVNTRTNLMESVIRTKGSDSD